MRALAAGTGQQGHHEGNVRAGMKNVDAFPERQTGDVGRPDHDVVQRGGKRWALVIAKAAPDDSFGQELRVTPLLPLGTQAGSSRT